MIMLVHESVLRRNLDDPYPHLALDSPDARITETDRWTVIAVTADRLCTLTLTVSGASVGLDGPALRITTLFRE